MKKRVIIYSGIEKIYLTLRGIGLILIALAGSILASYFSGSFFLNKTGLSEAMGGTFFDNFLFPSLVGAFIFFTLFFILIIPEMKKQHKPE